jgi:hypothetical protein
MKLTNTHKIIIGVTSILIIGSLGTWFFLKRKKDKEKINTQSTPKTNEIQIVDEFDSFKNNLIKIVPNLGTITLLPDADIKKAFETLKIDEKSKKYIFKVTEVATKPNYPWTYIKKEDYQNFFKNEGLDYIEAPRVFDTIIKIVKVANNKGQLTADLKLKDITKK